MPNRVALAALMLTCVPAAASFAAHAAARGAAPVGYALATTVEPAVAGFYQSRRNAPLWLSARSGDAANKLISVLKRAQLDGLASGPRLAVEAERALARAQSGDPAAIAQAERLLSSAWVMYVRALRTPTAGMIYGDPTLAPKAPHPDMILMQAAGAGSLSQHVEAVSEVNPFYAQLRDAAWNEVQLGGPAMPDRRVLTNLDRARALPAKGRFVVVDAASQQLFMFENGQVRDSMKVVVGKPEHATPMIASRIHYATLNPYWNVPDDLLRERIAPNVVKRGLPYLKSKGYEVLGSYGPDAEVIDPKTIDWKGVAAGRVKVRLRQLPGADNAMGEVKFSFPNSAGIYLHDTPEKQLFAQSKRTFSAGCVRLEDAQRLGRWLLGREPRASSDAPEQHVQLREGVPVYITYLTAQANGGQLSFLDDVYRRDVGGGSRVASGW